MFDALLGRASLKARIEELEMTVEELSTEADRLAERYDRESERRKRAVTARQDAEERANLLEDRIAQLEGELERERETGGRTVQARHHERLRGDRLASVLSRLESFRSPNEGALTTTVEDGVPEALSDVLGERAVILDDVAPCLVLTDDAGIISVALRPPRLPDLQSSWDGRFAIDRPYFEPTGRFLLALIRADLFAAGVYDETECVEFDGFESRVKGSHSKGGFSQSRFERIRDEQIEAHLERCRESIANLSENVDRRYLVGQREIVDGLAAEMHPDETKAVDATGNPREALEDAFRSFWTTDIWVL